MIVNGVTHTLPWSSSFVAGSSVSLEAVPATGWSFVSWSGDLMRDYNSAIVLGGPGITATDVSRATAAGFAGMATITAGDPAFAYVTLDVLRLDPGEPLSVVFEARSVATPTDPVASLPATVPNLAAAKAAAQASGVPYLTCHADLSGLAPGEYVMGTVIGGESLKRTALLAATARTP